MENEDYTELVEELSRFSLDAKLQALVTNYQVKPEDFVVQFETLKFNL
jgi:hypothetical protein